MIPDIPRDASGDLQKAVDVVSWGGDVVAMDKAAEEGSVGADEQSDVEVGLEVGRFALRTFRFSVEEQTEAVGATIGWWSDGRCRVWRSPTYDRCDEDWLDGTCTAVCHAWSGSVKHHAPNKKCGCGIYGSLSYADLLNQFRGHTHNIVAVIAAEGTTIIGDRGLRTQFARVVAYWVMPANEFMRIVARGQFRDAVAYADPQEMIDAYGLAQLPPAGIENPRRHGPEYWV